MNGGGGGDRKQASKGRRERRKAKSRDAARHRRGLECSVFDDMLAVLPLPSGCKEQLDKASVVRLTISCIKLRELMQGISSRNADTVTSESRLGSQSASGGVAGEGCGSKDVIGLLHCFLLLLSSDGDVVFVTENISKFLGTTQLDVIGNRIFDFLHPCDHDEMKAMLHEKVAQKCVFFSRFKCVQQSNGRLMPSKSAAYKVVKFTGRPLPSAAPGQDAVGTESAAATCEYRHLLLTGELIPNPSAEPLHDMADDNTFISCHALDMKFTACDAKAAVLLHYDLTALIGTSLYDYIHGCDSKAMEKFFKSLYSKGQSCTDRYRFLCNGGGYVWMISKASVVTDRKSGAPQHVECIHTVLSDTEDAGITLSTIQGSVLSAVALTASDMASKGSISRGESSEYSSIVEDTEALFSELKCHSATCSNMPSPVANDICTDDLFCATAENHFGDSVKQADSTCCANTADDIYAYTSGLFQDGTFGDGTQQPAMFDDPSEGLLIDTTCLDEYLDEDMSQRAPYIPMNMASDEVFASPTPLTCSVAVHHDTPQCSPTTAGLPPQLFQTNATVSSYVGHWHEAPATAAPATSCEVMRTSHLLSTSTSRVDSVGWQLHWPAHAHDSPVVTSSGNDRFGRDWPYEVCTAQPSAAHSQPPLPFGTHSMLALQQLTSGIQQQPVSSAWGSNGGATLAGKEPEHRLQDPINSSIQRRAWESIWVSCGDSAFLEPPGGNPVREQQYQVGKHRIAHSNSWSEFRHRRREDSFDSSVGVSTLSFFGNKHVGIKRLSSCSQPDLIPRKKRTLSLDVSLPAATERAHSAHTNGVATHKRSSAGNLWHCTDTWPGGGVTRWPPLSESTAKTGTDHYSCIAQPAAGFDGRLAADQAHLPAMRVEDLQFF